MALTYERLTEVLDYNSETGVFTWLKATARKITPGDEAGTIDTDGRLVITLDRKRHYASRLAWFYVHGAMPAFRLDHRDNNQLHNWISNLRQASTSQNAANMRLKVNNTSGFKGVRWFGRDRKWHARIKKNYKEHHLGYFNTPEEAHAAYVAAAARMFGEFARAG